MNANTGAICLQAQTVDGSAVAVIVTYEHLLANDDRIVAELLNPVPAGSDGSFAPIIGA